MPALRIGLFTYGMNQHLTGIGRYTCELSYALRRVQPDIHVILLNPYSESPLGWYRDFPTYPIPFLKRLPSVLVGGHALLERAARRLNLDVIHDPCGIAPFMAQRGPSKRVVTVHDAIPRLFPALQPPLTRLVYRTLLPAARWTVDAIITPTEHSRADLIQCLGYAPARIHVAPQGVFYPSSQDIANWKLKAPSVALSLGLTSPYFLFVGELNPRKNLSRVMAALASLHVHHPQGQLGVVGPMPSWGKAPPIPRFALNAGTVIRLGYVNDETLHVLYAGAIALVYPSLYEGFGFPILEAMAHGTPVITSNRSAMAEVAGDAALLVNPFNSDDIAQAMARLLQDADLRQHLIRNGRQRAIAFSWNHTAQKTVHVYQSVLNPKSQR